MLPITVFTPTYNRAHTLPRLYQSLLGQSFADFEWIVINDGSTDGTDSLIGEWIEDKRLDIRYMKVPNGGKYRAINKAARLARGELFFIVDSDDCLLPHSLRRIWELFGEIRDDSSFCGLAGSLVYPDGRRIGGDFPGERLDCTSLELRHRYRVNGDMAEVVRTDVMREFPFPEVEGENFCDECLVWNRMALKYRMRFLAEPVYVTEYLPDGLSVNLLRHRYRSSRLAMITSAEIFNLPVPLKERLRAAFIYWRCAFGRTTKNDRMLSPLSLLLCLPGRLMRIYDTRRVRKMERKGK